jgi:hypothetical protein
MRYKPKQVTRTFFHVRQVGPTKPKQITRTFFHVRQVGTTKLVSHGDLQVTTVKQRSLCSKGQREVLGGFHSSYFEEFMFCDVMPCKFVDGNRRFGLNECLNCQEISSLKRKALDCFEMLPPVYQTTVSRFRR